MKISQLKILLRCFFVLGIWFIVANLWTLKQQDVITIVHLTTMTTANSVMFGAPSRSGASGGARQLLPTGGNKSTQQQQQSSSSASSSGIDVDSVIQRVLAKHNVDMQTKPPSPAPTEPHTLLDKTTKKLSAPPDFKLHKLFRSSSNKEEEEDQQHPGVNDTDKKKKQTASADDEIDDKIKQIFDKHSIQPQNNNAPPPPPTPVVEKKNKADDTKNQVLKQDFEKLKQEASRMKEDHVQLSDAASAAASPKATESSSSKLNNDVKQEASNSSRVEKEEINKHDSSSLPKDKEKIMTNNKSNNETHVVNDTFASSSIKTDEASSSSRLEEQVERRIKREKKNATTLQADNNNSTVVEVDAAMITTIIKDDDENGKEDDDKKEGTSRGNNKTTITTTLVEKQAESKQQQQLSDGDDKTPEASSSSSSAPIIKVSANGTIIIDNTDTDDVAKISSQLKVAQPKGPVVMNLDKVWYTQKALDFFINDMARPFQLWNGGGNNNNTHQDDDLYAWCTNNKTMNDGILYVKLPKCASSTASGVALRVADTLGRRELNQDCSARFRHGWASKKDRQYGSRNKATSFLWSLIREPSKRLVSHYFFEQVSRQGMEPTQAGVLEYLRGTTDMKKTFLLRYLKVFAYNDKAPKVMKETMLNYDFIGVTDRMDESLVVLSILMRVPVADVILLSSKVAGGYDAGRSGMGCVKLAPKQHYTGVDDFLKTHEWKKNNWDQVFYQVVNKSLDMTIDAVGVEKVERKLKRFKRLSQRVQDECLAEAIFPCPETLPNHTELSKADCYFSDGGCGHKCIDRVLSRESSEEWHKMQKRLNRTEKVFPAAAPPVTTTAAPIKAAAVKADAVEEDMSSPLMHRPLTKSSKVVETTPLPPWIQDYVEFHNNSTKGGKIKDGVPFLVYQCHGGCAGLGGRLKAIIKSFHAAVCSNRVFLIDAPFPFPLQDYLPPNLVQWNASFPNETATLPIFVRVGAGRNMIDIPDNETGVRIQKAHGKKMLDLTQIFKTPTCQSFLERTNTDMPNPYDIEQLLFHWGSQVLFQFAPQVHTRAAELKTNAGLEPNKPYVGIHLRVGCNDTSCKEDAMRLRRAKNNDNYDFVQCYHKFRDQHGLTQGYVAADSPTPKAELHDLDASLKIATNVENFHIDRSLSINTTQGLKAIAAIASTGEDKRAGKNYNLHGGASLDVALQGTLDLYAELLLLTEAECLVMTKSSLSFAAMLMAPQPRCGVLKHDCTNETVKIRNNKYVVKTGKLELRNHVDS